MVDSVLNNDKLGSDSINTDITDLLPAPVNLELQDEFYPVVEPLICILQYCVYCSLVLEQSTLLYKLIVYSMKYSILQ